MSQAMGELLDEIFNENGFIDVLKYNSSELYDNPDMVYIPEEFADDNDTFDMILEMTYDLSKKFKIAETAGERDKEGVHLKNGKIILPSGMENIYSEIVESGITGILVPEEYGGFGLDYKTQCSVIETLSKADASVGVSLSIHGSCVDAIDNLGTDEAKEKYLPELVGGKWGAIALTESGAGSDLRSVSTRYELEDDHYVVNGEKIMITNGGWADYYILLAKGEKGLSAFIVEKDFEGFETTGIENKMGLKASPTSTIVLSDCKIPKENLLGKEGKGLCYVLETLSGGRITIAAQAVGIAQAAYECAKEHAEQRTQFGRPINEIPDIRDYLSFMKDNISRARSLYFHAADSKDKIKDGWFEEASIAKIFASERGFKACDLALQIFGGYGYTKDFPLERYLRDIRITRIYEGTSEVQKFIIERARKK